MRWFLVLTLCFCFSASASIIKKPPAKPVEAAYHQLVCTEQDKAHIFEIISTMGENSKLALLFKQNHLKEIGAQIDHVHPLKFLSTIFVNPYLKSCMFNIWDDYFKKNGFLDGLGPSLTREASKGKLTQYLKEFAAEINVPLPNMQSYFDAMDWEGLVAYLIYN